MMPDQTSYQPQSELPRPQPVEATASNDHQPQISAGEYIAPVSELPQQGVSAAVPIASAASMPQQDPAATVAQSAAAPSLPSTGQAALAANDTDLIEKEWVERAKSIVDQTKDNPHMQNKAMSKFKADYVKKRYNKELKVTEG